MDVEESYGPGGFCFYEAAWWTSSLYCGVVALRRLYRHLLEQTALYTCDLWS